jgi:pimeloyl-ACP methyl ester carboxylesterase
MFLFSGKKEKVNVSFGGKKRRRNHFIMKKRKKWLIGISIFVIILAVIFIFGPRPDTPDFKNLTLPSYSTDLRILEDSVNKAEALWPLKPDNQARILWAEQYVKTPYAMVYLHGNAASQEEGDPIHEALAYRYGCNLFLARLAQHGLQGENPMLNITPEDWMQSALDAIAVGQRIGEKVILVSTSTGSTLGLYLASKYPDLVDGHIMLSPNIDMYDPRSFLLVQPYGLKIARMITGSEFYGWKAPGPARNYWYTNYRIEGLVSLKSMIRATMTKATFKEVTDPLLMVYYYKDEENQDHLVSVDRMLEMFEQVGTVESQKRAVAVTDAGTHIIGSDLFNHQLQSVWIQAEKFCEEVLQLHPVNDSGWEPFLDKRTQ